MEHPDAAFYLSALPARLRGVLTPKIKPGETVLWAGQPDPVRLLFSRTGPFLYGTVVAGGVLLLCGRVWERMHGYFDLFDLGTLLFPFLFAIFLLLASVTLMASPLLAFVTARNTVYVITDRRAFSLTCHRKSDNDIVPVVVRRHEELKSLARKDGSGTLLFFYDGTARRTAKERWHDFLNEGYTSCYPLTEFSEISDVRNVERLIRETVLKPGNALPSSDPSSRGRGGDNSHTASNRVF